MSTQYKFHNPEGVYFVSFATVGWADVFTRIEYKEIFIESLRYFQQHRFPKAIILQAVYFKFRFTLSYRDVEELLRIQGVKMDHSTLQRWVFKFSPLIEANMNK
jgi:hypothetical protein